MKHSVASAPRSSAVGAGGIAQPDLSPFPYRVFGVGMNKTGTSSLGRALRQLGVVPLAGPKLAQRAGLVTALFERGDYEPALRYARMYRAFEDRPWNVWEMYRLLDERYPGSRFVLTRRDPESWWRSVRRWITVTKPGIGERYRQHLRAASLREADMLEAYARFNQEICDYFAGRDDFQVLDIEAGDGWETLSRFLALPVPDGSFPHANRQSYEAGDAERFRRSKRARPPAGRRPGPQGGRAALRSPSLGPRHCVRCANELARAAEGASTLAGRLPSWAKEAYRAVQRRALFPRQTVRACDLRLQALRREHPGLSLDGMAVVTCFFNPCGYRSRIDNYRRFRSALAACGLPVLTVEMAVGDDPFCLGAEAGEVLAVRSPHPMWQKERLLNLGIRELLARGYRRIVWLDADVVFEDRLHWPWHVAAALERSAVCQVFGQALVEQDGGRRVIPGVAALRYHREVGGWLYQDRRGPSPRRPVGYPLGYSGYGWAARAEVLAAVELYDRAVVGGGDKLIYAASGKLADGWQRRVAKLITTTQGPCGVCGHLNHAAGYLADYFAWAERWNRAVAGTSGWTDRTIRSLYHGDRKDRSYSQRRDILLRHEYDPAADLAEDESGCWRWASDKPGLHLDVQSYFFERREDS